MTTISALPTAPSRDDPTNFNARAEAFNLALSTFRIEANTVAGEVNAAAAAASQSGAATHAANASNSATAAANSATIASGAVATSGAVLWVSGTTYSVGNLVYSPINLQNYRRKTNGAGTTDPSQDSANWQGLGIVSLPKSGRTSNTMLASSDNGKIIDITSGTFTQTFDAAATLGSGWFCYIRNSGTGDITLDPNGSETIDGVTSFIMYPSEVRLIQCDGTAFSSIILTTFYKVFTSSGSFNKPPGYSAFSGMAWGAGASGARSGSAAAISRGGGGGMCFPFQIAAAKLSSSETVTIGAGGLAYTGASGTTHNAGGDTSIGSLLTATGAISNTGAGIGTAVATPISFEGSTGATPSAIANYGGGACPNTPASSSCGSRFGGGAGGGCDTAGVAYTAGLSLHAGNGGNASSASNGADGAAPGGGGGATQTGTQSGAGARGELRIWGVL